MDTCHAFLAGRRKVDSLVEGDVGRDGRKIERKKWEQKNDREGERALRRVGMEAIK